MSFSVKLKNWMVRLLFLQGLTGMGQAENWPQWRGPFLNGATTETNLAQRLNKQDRVVWAAPLAGRSGATPVVWQNHIFVPSPDEQKNLNLYCVDATSGKVLWKNEVGIGDKTVGKNNMASCSAVTDGKRVYTLFGTSDLAAYDFAGREVWKLQLKKEFGAFAVMFLYGASPLIHGDKLYVPLLQRNPPSYGHAADNLPERKSWLICLDCATGTVLWKQERKSDAREEAMEAYTTPLFFESESRQEIVVAGADCMTGHLLETGEEIWRFDGFNTKKNPGGRVVPSPVAGAGLIFACGPKREQLVAVRTAGKGILTDKAVVWKTEQNIPDVPTPLFYQGRLYVLDGDRQLLNCFEPETGKLLGQCRLGIREIFYASPTGADGKIYCFSEEGTVVVLSAAPKPEVLSTTSFGEGPCMSSVVVSNKRFYLRTAKNLYCIRGDQ